MEHALQILSTTGTVSPADAADCLNRICNLIAAQNDLSPENPVVNSSLGFLVAQIEHWSHHTDIEIEDLEQLVSGLTLKLPELCAKAECAMEKWWARQIISERRSLEQFWYLDNYRALTEGELRLASPEEGQHIVFLGSGALPVSALVMAEILPGCRITCVERDRSACLIARALIEHLGFAERISVMEGDALIHRYEPDSLIICASLLNASGLYELLHKQKVGRLIVRDSEKLYRLLYKPSRLPHHSLYRQSGRTPSDAMCINISRYFERREG